MQNATTNSFFQMASVEKLFADEDLFKLDEDQNVCIVLRLFLLMIKSVLVSFIVGIEFMLFE